MFPTVVNLILVVVGLASFFLAMLFCDALILHEYNHHPNDWQADGEPCGFFLQPRWR